MAGTTTNGGGKVPRNGIADNGQAQSVMLSQMIGRKVITESDTKLGKVKDLVFVDDPKYAEVTQLLVGRPYGDRPFKVPWSEVVMPGPDEIIVKNPPGGSYAVVGPEEDLLLLKDYILDKRILDTNGFAVEVVYDIQLLLVDKKMFVVAADVSNNARMRRLGLGKLLRVPPPDADVGGLIPWKYVQSLGPGLTSTKGDIRLTIARNRLGEVHPEDMADILEDLDREERIHVFNALTSKAAAATLDATEPSVQREILADISAERVAQIFEHLSAVEIADVISILPSNEAEEFQKALSGSRAARVQELLTQHDVPASILAVHRILEFPGDLVVEDAFVKFRKEAPSTLVVMYIYVVDKDGHLRGVIDINELLQANPENKLEEIMVKNVVTVAPETRRGTIEALFRRYRFRAIPVVDNVGKIVGVVREKDAFSTGDEIRLAR